MFSEDEHRLEDADFMLQRSMIRIMSVLIWFDNLGDQNLPLSLPSITRYFYSLCLND